MKKFFPLVSVSFLILTILGLAVIYGCGITGTGSGPTTFDYSPNYATGGMNIQTYGVNNGVSSTGISATSATSGTIKGKLLESYLGSGIEGVLVMAPSATSGMATTYTDPNGNYVLTGVQLGKIPVTFAHSDYIPMTIVCNSSTINLALYKSSSSSTGVGTIEADIRHNGTRIETAWVWGFSESQQYNSRGRRTFPPLPKLTLSPGTVHLAASAQGIGGTSQETIVTLLDSETKLMTLEISSSVCTLEGVLSGINPVLTDKDIFAWKFYDDGHMLSYGDTTNLAGSEYSLQMPPSNGEYVILLQASTNESVGGSGSVSSSIYYPLSISDGQTISKDFTFEQLPTMEAPSGTGTSTPTFSWTPTSGSPDLYMISAWSDGWTITWLCITEDLNVQYPAFTSGSTWEMTSGDYYCNVQAIYKPGANISNLDYAELMATGSKVSRSFTRPFTITP